MKITSVGKRFLTPFDLLSPQILLAMKLTVFFLTICFVSVSAGTYSQAVTYKASNEPLVKVLKTVEQQTGYNFFYNDKDIAAAKPVTVELRSANLNDALTEIFKGQPLEYDVKGKTIVVSVKKQGNRMDENNEELMASIDIKGKVIDENGNPVVAAVTVKGTGRGVVTNEKGEFTISKVDANAILIINSVNIDKTYEVQVKGRTEIRIDVKLKVTELDEVGIKGGIPNGYGNISAARMVGAIERMDSAAFHSRPGMDIISRLDGRVNALYFDKKGIAPPLTIRGISTLNSNTSPLIVLDNFPYTGDLNLINPNDVENITVLKDAAAASVWGAYAGNGVIIISTKKGKLNSPMQVTFQANTTLEEKPNLYYYPQISSSDVIDIEKLLFSKGFYDANLGNITTRPAISPVVEILAKLRAGDLTQIQADTQIDALRKIDVRDQANKYIYQSAIRQQYYLNLRGGNNVHSYSFSGGYNRSRPNIKGSNGAEQYALNVSNNFKPLRNMELNASVNFTRGIDKTAGLGGVPGSPYTQLVDDRGNYLPVSSSIRMSWADTAGGGKLLNWLYRPLEEIRLANNKTTSQAIGMNVNLNYRFFSWLKAGVYYRYFSQTQSVRKLYSTQTYFMRDLINRYTQISGNNVTYNIPLGSELEFSNQQSGAQNLRGQLDFSKRWGKHDLTGLVAAEISEVKSGSSGDRFYGYDPNNGSYAIGLNFAAFYPIYGGLSTSSQRIPFPQSVVDDGNVSRSASMLTNISYTYDGRYTLYSSARKDGANIFGVNTNNRWKPLWSAGIGWNISRESFYGVNWLPSLRLRASYGYMGNTNNRIPALTVITYSSTLATYTNYLQATVSGPPNPDLRWEKVGMINAGIDFSFSKNRLAGSLEYFEKKSTDLISGLPVDPTLGVSQATINYANLRGKGFELALRSINLAGEMRWETSYGLSYAKTIVTKLYGGKFKASDYISAGLHTAEGQMAYTIAGYRWEGLDPISGDPMGYLNGQISKNYTGIFSDSIQNQNVIRPALPMFTGFLANSFSFRGFELSFNINYRFKFYFRKPALSYSTLFAGGSTHSDYYLRWQRPGDEKYTDVPSLVYPTNGNRELFYQNAEVNLLKGDHIRLQDIRLQYAMTKSRFRRLPVQNIQFFLYVNNLNLLLWKANKVGIDPDFANGLGVSSAVPSPRTWTAGISLNL